MADVTVRQLAEQVKRSVESLLQQMQVAGLGVKQENDTVSESDKIVLLNFLKRTHGGAEVESQNITLKRKTTTTLRTTAPVGGKSKTVAVEVRKKRTYVREERIGATIVQDEQLLQNGHVDSIRGLADLKIAEEARLKAEVDRKAAEEVERLRLEQLEEERRREESVRIARDIEAKERKMAMPSVKVREETAQERAHREAELSKQRVLDEQRQRQEDQARREAEEVARKHTLDQARRMAEELERRARVEVRTEDVPLARGLVGSAYEDSFAREDREIRRGGATRTGKGRGKKRDEEVSFKPQIKALSTALSRKHGFERPVEKQIYEVAIGENISVSELAQKMAIKSREVIRVLMKMGETVTENQTIDQATAALVVEEMGHTPVFVSASALEDSLRESMTNMAGVQVARAPVVTIMGHVDHGKTSLLDYIRRTRVAAGEAGGITQHIGAYHVQTPRGMITFLDTPGHAAFTGMRARGAQLTDIVVIVVAADDGVMPQTEEAIDHARAADVPLIVAVNKMDKASADPDRVLHELSVKQVIPEEWGGDAQVVRVSAHTGMGIDQLLEAILIQAELLELQAVVDGAAQGVVIEARIDKGRGAVASLLVQKGTLNHGDLVLAGMHYGRVRAMHDENGQIIRSAGPSIPVEILGLPEAPDAGDEFLVVDDERKAREVADFRAVRDRHVRMSRHAGSKLENVFASLGKNEASTVNLVLKTDVRGSLEALTGALVELSTAEVRVVIVSSGVGAITESDVSLAESTNAVILGFNVRTDTQARNKCQQDGIEVRYYSIIYELIDDVKAAMSGLLSPEHRETILGVAQVRDVFRSSKFGAAAGCMVMEGIIYRNRPVRVLREDVVIFQGELESLRRFKDDVQEVRHGMECGLAVKGYSDVRTGDKIEVYEIQVIQRSL